MMGSRLILLFACCIGYVAAQYSDGHLFLLEGDIPGSGRLEMYYSFRRGTICDNNFDAVDGNVACRQLGYAGLDKLIFENIYGIPSTSKPIYLDNVECTGEESRLIDCPSSGIGVHNCEHTDDVGLQCTNTIGFEEGDLRLVGGFDAYEGRLEIFHEGQWGTVCDDTFTQNEADVACRQLGYQGVRHFISSSRYRRAAGEIWLDDVSCTGDEAALSECSFTGWSQDNCGHEQDVAFVCDSDLTATPLCNYDASYIVDGVPCPRVQFLPASNLIYLSWTLPSGVDRSVVEHYERGRYWDVTREENRFYRNQNSWPIMDPVADTQYSFRVAGKDSSGRVGTFSDWMHFTTPDVIFRETEVYRNDSKCEEDFPAANGRAAICPGKCCKNGECSGCYSYTTGYIDLNYIALEKQMEELYPIADRPVPSRPTPDPDAGPCPNLLTEFIFALPKSWNRYKGYVLIASRVRVDVNVTIIGTDFLISIPVSGYESIPLPTWALVTGRGLAVNKTIRVTATGVVSVHCMDEASGGDGFRVLPTHQLGYNHRIASYPYSSSGGNTYPGYISITAIDKAAIVVVRNDDYYINLDETINLNPYETYRVNIDGGRDLTGTSIESTQPVAVVSGVASARVPTGGFPGSYSYDGVLEQNIPIKSWGRRYVLAPFRGKPSGYVYRILTQSQSATVDIQGTSRTINANSMYESETGETVLVISSDNPVTVIQYMKQSFADGGYGDSAMVINPPVETYVNDVTFSVFDYSYYDSYLHVTINCTHADGLIFDEDTSMSSWDRRESSDNQWCAIYNTVSTGAHRVRHSDTQVKFSVVVYGLRDPSWTPSAYIYIAGFQSIPDTDAESTSPSDSDIAVSGIQEIFYQGQDITLTCRQQSDAKQRPLWRLNTGATIFPAVQGGSEHIDTKCKSPTSTELRIVDAQVGDSGDYVCFSETSQEVVDINIVQGACEPLNIPICEDLGYKYTYLPNFLNQTQQQDAELYLQTFAPFIQVECSADLVPYLCSMFAPECLPEKQEPVSPSREMCEAARSGCEGVMRPYGFSWPESLACENLPATTEPPPPTEPSSSIGSGSSSFIRWGRSDCPSTSEMIYSGFAAGTHWNLAGSGSNFLCLHEEPEYENPVAGFDTERARIDGVEFETTNFPPLSLSNNYDMVCAACHVASRGAMITIPARITCPSGWTREYYGYLMSSRHDHKRSEFICVDSNPTRVSGTQADQAGSVIYPVEGRCLDTNPGSFKGGLPCDKFPNGNELSCVVCTK